MVNALISVEGLAIAALNTIGFSLLYANTDPEKIKLTLIAQAKYIVRQLEIFLPIVHSLLFFFVKP
jgi:hypothetical protein